MAKLLVSDDDAQVLELVSLILESSGHEVVATSDPRQVQPLAAANRPDAIILDVLMPVSGFEILGELRGDPRTQAVPILFLSGLSEGSDRVRGLREGADDYLVKPFAFEELLARIRALLRRPGARAEAILRFQDIELDPASGRALRNGRNMALSAREFSLLRVFLSNPRRILTRARLYESIWNNQYDGLSNVLDVYVNYLRNKLEDTGGDRVIHAVRGRGYILGEEE